MKTRDREFSVSFLFCIVFTRDFNMTAATALSVNVLNYEFPFCICFHFYIIDLHLGAKVKRLYSARTDGPGKSSMFEGKNIHSSPVDGKLLCSYSEKVCMQRRLNGFAFCIRHILEDKGAPFKQCQFFAKYNKSRCINPVPILEERE